MFDFSKIKQLQNVYYLTRENSNFSTNYLAVRKKENRILSDTEVKKLPHLNLHEWPYRVKSTVRFTKYIKSKQNASKILTIGCGNGWFSNKIAQISNKNQVIGLDINREELEQASRVFKRSNLKFVYADLFEISDFFTAKFDVITLNGTIQYFEDFNSTITLLKSFLKPNGEIHIMDSPFYKASEIKHAMERTKKYYSELGYPEIAENYYAHDISLVKEFDTLYKYKWSILDKILGEKDSPFSWHRFKK